MENMDVAHLDGRIKKPKSTLKKPPKTRETNQNENDLSIGDYHSQPKTQRHYEAQNDWPKNG